MKKTVESTRAEHPIAEPSARWIDSTIAAFIIAFGGVFIGGWISVAGNSIGADSSDFLRFVQCGVSLGRSQGAACAFSVASWTLAFWIVVLLWAAVLAWRLRADGRRDTQRVMDLIHAIHRTPNLNVFRNYPRLYIPTAFTSLYVESATEEPTDGRIRAVLYTLASMAREFARADGDARYGANIMLLSQGRDFPERLFTTFLFDPGDLYKLALVAHLPDTLCVDDTNAKAGRNIVAVPRISLPVPASLTTFINGHEISQALPGAPTALLTDDGVSVQERTSTMSEQCAGLGQLVAGKIEEYFARTGPGKDIRSFVSFRIERGDGTGDPHPVGVLNIDSNQEYLLGRDPEYYLTFFALVSPILAMLGPLVEKYATEYWKLQLQTAP